MPNKPADKSRILFVDDEPDIVTVAKKALVNHGFHVDAFTDSKEALSQFKPGYYDLIILDVRMPSTNGFELAKQIWVVDQHAKICFMTAFEIHESEARKVFKNFKTHCYITKPIAPSQLIEQIESQLKNA